MRSSSELERAAIMAVARHFRASLEHGADPRDACLIIAGKKIAVEVTAPGVALFRRSRPKPPRLRFDRVVVGLLGRLRAALTERVPPGATAVVTITAPIRLASRTAAMLEEMIGALLRGRSGRRPLRKTVNGNQIRIQIMRRGGTSTSPLAGFVHNRDSDPGVLFDLTHALLRIGSARHSRTGFSRDRWLVIATEQERAWIPTYRHACSELFARADFQRIVLVSAAGDVSTLAA
jgi:hypothetical protein